MAIVVMFLLVGCGIRSIMMANGSLGNPQQDSIRTEVSIPCKESSYDDAYYFRALGTSSSHDMRHVRTLAYRDAQQRLNMKITEATETEFTFNANVICEEVMVNETNGVYEGYVVLEIAKDAIKYKRH